MTNPTDLDEGSVMKYDAESARQLTDLIRGGRSIAIAMDVNFFIGREAKVQIRSPILSKLEVLLKKELKLLVPIVWEQELLKHLDDTIDKAKNVSQLKRIQRETSTHIRDSDLTAQLDAIIEKVSAINASVEAAQFWTNFKAANGANTLDLPPDCANEVWSMYVNSKAPFESSGEKKCEFPDAFALLSLANFSRRHPDVSIIVLSRDKGVHAFCKSLDRFLTFGDVAHVLECFSAVDSLRKMEAENERVTKLITGDPEMMKIIVGVVESHAKSILETRYSETITQVNNVMGKDWKGFVTISGPIHVELPEDPPVLSQGGAGNGEYVVGGLAIIRASATLSLSPWNALTHSYDKPLYFDADPNAWFELKFYAEVQIHGSIKAAHIYNLSLVKEHVAFSTPPESWEPYTAASGE